jgi:hypothetical protein
MEKNKSTKEKGTSAENEVYTGFQASSEQIEGWKKEHKGVSAVEVYDTDGSLYRVYFKKPSRVIISKAMQDSTKNPMLFNETLFDNCHIAGDVEKIKSDDDLYMSACTAFAEIVQLRKAELKKL